MQRLLIRALQSLDGLAIQTECFCDGRDRRTGFDGGGAGHIGYQHLPVLLRGEQVRVGLDERFILHGLMVTIYEHFHHQLRVMDIVILEGML